MKKNFLRNEEPPIRLRYYFLGSVVLWSILVGLSLTWNLRTEKSGILEAARIEARAGFDKDVVYRRWNAGFGGVYAPVTEVTQPNPYLDVPERDITTSLGKELTMINPAYMTRQVHELALKAYGIRGHITSLDPIRPANAPDPWETRALKAFQAGLKEASSVEEIEGSDHMRLMRPLLTEQSCLKCHAAQGYKLGDIRGGISVSTPMAPHTAIAQSHILALCVGHGLLWLAGLVGIGLGFRRLNHQIQKRIGVGVALRKKRHDLDERVKKLNCLYGISNLVDNPGISLEEILQGTVNLIPPSWQYPAITCSRIILESKEYRTKNFKKTSWGQVCDIKVNDQLSGKLEVYYLEEKPESHEGPFLKEERSLIGAIAERLGNIVEHRQAEEALKRIEWLLEARSENVDQIQYNIPSYGDLTQLNTCRFVLDAVGKDVLADIVNDYLELLHTSAAVYEKNGDYALGIFTSSWCQFLDQASQDLCGTDDNKKALQSGKWLCHESCWSDVSKNSIEKDQPVDFECHGGLHIYAVPIRVGGKAVGSINFGYGDPPRDPHKLKEIADKYNVSVDELLKYADAYESRPSFIIEIAKHRLLSSARLIGEIIERKQTEEALRKAHDGLEQKVRERTTELANVNDDLKQEINERKQAEEALKREKRRVEEYLNVAGVMLAIVNADENITMINKKGFEMLGYNDGELIGKNWFDVLVPSNVRGRVRGVFGQLMAGNVEPVEYYENSLLTKDGEERLVLFHNAVLRDHNGQIIGALTSGEDITERKQSEEALRESEKRFRHLFQRAPLGYQSLDAEGCFLDVNQAWLDLLGYSRDQVIGSWFGDFLASHEIDSYKQRFPQFIATGEVHTDLQMVQRSGSTIFVHIDGRIGRDERGEFNHTHCILHDITERKRAEEALRESEERYRALFERSLEMVYLCDFEGNFIDANDSALELIGYTKKDIKSLNFSSLLDKDQLPRAFEAAEEILKTGSQRDLTEYELRRKDGEHIFVESKGALIYRDGKPYAIQGIARNVTERKRAQEALLNQKYFLQKAQEIGQIGTWELDIKKNELLWTDENYKIFGLPIGTRLTYEIFLDCVHPDDREYVDKEWKAAFDKKPYDIEHRLLVDGDVKWVREKAELQFNEKDECIRGTGFTQDITERKKAEEEQNRLEDQLQKARKMEAMGLMAGGVAHDLNNILSGIVSYPELLLMDLPEDSPLRKPIKTIQESGMRAADVVDDLLTIAKGVATGKEVLNLNTLIEEYLSSAEHQKLEKTRSFVDSKTELDSDLLNMSGSPTHIKKILMNLVANASEAIEESGTVTISTANRYLDEPLKGYEDVRIGEYTVLTVSDDGSGISPEDLERIFEPFYTKRVMGRIGTGLGLAVVWNTVQGHNGYINVKSGEKGTMFELYFPVTREEVAGAEAVVPVEDYLGHGEKILVVDDEERQREIAGGILTRLGYNAETVSSGEEAIEYVKENSVDLIVLDMVMPKGINGRKTYEEIIKIRPGQKAIIASGYAKTKEVDIAQELGAGKYIKKPYTLAKVGVAVKEELEK